MKKRNLFIKAIILIIGAYFLLNNSNSKETIKIDGSSTVFPITEAIAEECRNEMPNINVTVGVSGTGGGFKKFIRNEIDICNASRSIKESEARECEEKGIEYIELEVAYDGLAVIKHPENDWLSNITVEQLKMIWEPGAQGKILKWNDVREDWPNEKINLYGPGTASGTYDYFAEAICGKDVGTRGDYSPSEDDNVLVKGVSGDKYSLGFFGLAYYDENKNKLSLVSDNGVTQTIQSVSDGTYAPLSRPIFIYVNKTASAKKEVKEFVTFYLEKASEIVEEVGYIPLPDEAYTNVQNKYKKFIE